MSHALYIRWDSRIKENMFREYVNDISLKPKDKDQLINFTQ